MKSLKRTLCLVLALVMVLGLFGIASAASFTDDNTIQYKEAVDVMTGIGAIDGMGDGTFNPKGTITRAQAAKLVTYTVLGKAAASSLGSVSSSFTDVTVAGGFSWAIPSIEYLVKQGVINGRGDGTFDPNGNIDGYAVLKMLLCALGYGAKGEYIGDQWTLNVAIDAGKNALTEGCKSTGAYSTPATREEVALYCFNAMQRQMVQYVSTLDVYSPLTHLEGTTTYPTSIMNGVYGYKNAGGGKLAVTTAGTTNGKDAFGAPANVWTYDGKEISKTAIPAAVTFTSAQTEANLKAALSGYKHDDAVVTGKVTVITNGEQAGSAITDDAGALTNVITALQSACANGTVVKVYANTNKYITDIVVIKTDLTKVASVNEVTKTVTLTTVTAAGAVTSSYTITAEAQPDLYAKVAGLKENDLVLVTPVDKNPAQGSQTYVAAAVSFPTQITGKLTSITNVTNIVTIDGKGYGVSAGTAVAAGNIKLDAGSDAAVWLDDYGFIVNIKAAESTYDVIPSFAFVLEGYESMPANKIIKMAKIVLPDGSIKDVPTVVGGSASTKASDGTLYKVAGIDKDTGAYALTPTVDKAFEDFDGTETLVSAYTGKDDGVTIAPAGLALKLNGNKAIKSTEKRLNSDVAGLDGDNYYNNFYSGNVKFIYVTKDAKNAYTVAEVKDGVQDVKTNTSLNAYAIIDSNDPKDVTSTPVVSAVILVNGEPQTAADTSKVLYIPNNNTGFSAVAKVSTSSMYNKVTKTYEDVNVWRVFENGVEKTMPITTNSITAGFYNYKASTTYDGAYEIEEAYGTGKNTVVNKAVSDTIEGNNPNNIGNSVYLTTATKDIDITNATFVDTRTDAQKAVTGQMPVTGSLSGVLEALKKYDLTVSVLYDVKTQAASIVYIDQAAAVSTFTITAATIGTANGQTATVTTSTTSVNKYGSYKVTVNITALTKAQKLTLTVADAGSGEKITYTTTKGGVTTPPAAYATNVSLAADFVGTVEFTVSNVTAASGANTLAFAD